MLDWRPAVAYIIKRYSNRKLYDPQHSRYVTLDDLKQLIRDGVELKVEDVDTGADLTSLTLTQILLEGERTHQTTVPATLLHQMIKHGEAWYELLDRTLKANPFENLSAGPKAAERFWTEWAAAAGVKAPGSKPAGTPPAPEAEKTSGTPNVNDELNALKEKLRSLEERVGKPRTTPRRRR